MNTTKRPDQATTGRAVPKGRPPLRRRMQARLMGLVNVPMRQILRLPFATPLSRNLMLVWLTGRRSGRVYRQPLSYVRQGDALLTPGGGKWKLNLREGQPVRMRLRGRDVLARPEIISDIEQIVPLIGVMAAANPMVRRFIGIPKGADESVTRERLETAVQYGFRVVRWHLDEPSQPALNPPVAASR